MKDVVQSNLIKPIFDELDLELKKYAIDNNVPIIMDDGLAFLETIIKTKNVKSILEIGTAIGYSAIRMCKAGATNVVTIERNEAMYQQALANISKSNFEKNINVIFADALEADKLLGNQKFDLIFIDAAKAQYTKFFNLYSPFLNADGIIVCDNMLFHGLVETDDLQKQSRSVRGLIRKLGAFHEFLLNHPDFDSQIYKIGDGMAVSIKRNK